MNLRTALSIAALTFTLVGAGCTSDTIIDGKAVTGMDVNSGKPSLPSGSSVQFEAVIQFADGTSKDVTADPETVWNSSDAAIAAVSAAGLVDAKSAGFADISAEYQGEKGNNRFAVTP